MEGIWIELILIAVAIIANGYFSGSEIALVSARPSRLAELRAHGISGAGVAEALKREPEKFLATIQIAITLVGTLASAVGGAAAVDALQPWLAGLDLPGAPRWSGPVALGLVVVVITFASLVLGELTPKALALRNPERWAARVARSIAALVQLLAVPGRILTWSTRMALTLIGQRDAPSAPPVSEEEVKYLVREGASHGVFERQESDLVHRVFQFTDTAVRHVMVPRPNVRALDIATPPEQVLQRAAELGHTRLPVCRGNLEETLGVVVIKDLLSCAAAGSSPALERLLHPPLFVPEVTPVSDVLRMFQRSRLHLALVVDEYGTVVGLVAGYVGQTAARVTEVVTLSAALAALKEALGSNRSRASPTAPISSTASRRSATCGSRRGCPSTTRRTTRRWPASFCIGSAPCLGRERRSSRPAIAGR